MDDLATLLALSQRADEDRIDSFYSIRGLLSGLLYRRQLLLSLMELHVLHHSSPKGVLDAFLGALVRVLPRSASFRASEALSADKEVAMAEDFTYLMR